MRRERLTWQGTGGWSRAGIPDAQLVLAFGNPAAFDNRGFIGDLRLNHPYAHLIGCCIADRLPPDPASTPVGLALAMDFDRHDVAVASLSLPDRHRAFAGGVTLGRELRGAGLCALILLADDESFDRAHLVAGLENILGPVPVAGDFGHPRIGTTSRVVQAGEISGATGLVAAVALYDREAAGAISPAGAPRSTPPTGRSLRRPGFG